MNPVQVVRSEGVVGGASPEEIEERSESEEKKRAAALGYKKHQDQLRAFATIERIARVQLQASDQVGCYERKIVEVACREVKHARGELAWAHMAQYLCHSTTGERVLLELSLSDLENSTGKLTKLLDSLDALCVWDQDMVGLNMKRISAQSTRVDLFRSSVKRFLEDFI